MPATTGASASLARFSAARSTKIWTTENATAVVSPEGLAAIDAVSLSREDATYYASAVVENAQ
jgi:hypothetical protein